MYTRGTASWTPPPWAEFDRALSRCCLGPMLFAEACTQAGGSATSSPTATATALTTCPETPMAAPPPDANTAGLTTSWWSDGVVWAGVPPPGAHWAARQEGQKVGWWRGVTGQLNVSGRRLDGASKPLQADILAGYGNYGFQSSNITIPTAGCWEITARVGDHTFRFVVAAA